MTHNRQERRTMKRLHDRSIRAGQEAYEKAARAGYPMEAINKARADAEAATLASLQGKDRDTHR